VRTAGDEVPAELARRETAFKRCVRHEASSRGQRACRRQGAKNAELIGANDERSPTVEQAKDKATPPAKAQRNFTDPSRAS